MFEKIWSPPACRDISNGNYPFLEAWILSNVHGRIVKWSIGIILGIASLFHYPDLKHETGLWLIYFPWVWHTYIVLYIFYFKHRDKMLWGNWLNIIFAPLPFSILYKKIIHETPQEFLAAVNTRNLLIGTASSVLFIWLIAIIFNLEIHFWAPAFIATLILPIDIEVKRRYIAKAA